MPDPLAVILVEMNSAVSTLAASGSACEMTVLEFLSPAGLEDFFEEIGGLPEGAGLETVTEIGTRYGLTLHPELIAELSELYGVSP